METRLGGAHGEVPLSRTMASDAARADDLAPNITQGRAPGILLHAGSLFADVSGPADAAFPTAAIIPALLALALRNAVEETLPLFTGVAGLAVSTASAAAVIPAGLPGTIRYACAALTRNAKEVGITGSTAPAAAIVTADLPVAFRYAFVALAIYALALLACATTSTAAIVAAKPSFTIGHTAGDTLAFLTTFPGTTAPAFATAAVGSAYLALAVRLAVLTALPINADLSRLTGPAAPATAVIPADLPLAIRNAAS